MRVVAVGGIFLLAGLFLVDVRSLFPSRPVRRTTVEVSEDDAQADPGWPHRRGPHYDAISDETELADSWPPEGPPVLWLRQIGRGYSGIIAVGDRVFTQRQTLSSQSVLCLAAESGEPIWEHRYGWPYEAAGMYPGPRATPTWHHGKIYFAGPRGLLECLRATDGRLLWSLNVHEKFDGQGTDFGCACSPLVLDGKVIMPVGGPGASVVALDAEDGSTVWAAGDEPASYCSALPITFAGRPYVVVFLQNALAVHDLQTGRLMCLEKYSTGYDEHAAAPLYDEPYLMVARPFQSGAECFRLHKEESTPTLTMTTAWYNRKFSNDTASSLLIDGHIYGFDLRDVQAKAHRPSRGQFRCLDLGSGEILWSTDQIGHATLIVAEGKLILLNDRGELLLARATPDRYEELARTQVFSDEICWTAPTLHQGRLYLRSPSKVACLYLGMPERLSDRQRAAARATSEIAGSTAFDFTRLVGGEREFAFDPPDLRELGRWYGFSMLLLVMAGAVGTLIHLALRFKWPVAAQRLGRIGFYLAALLLAAAGTPVFNRCFDPFIFTWPACLFVVHQVTLNVVVWSGRRPEYKGSRWLAMLAALFFLAMCLAYYLVCRRLSLAIEWIFLMGFLPSWPIAVPTAYRLQRQGHPIWDFLWAVASFSAYFWSAAAVILWKATGL